MLYSKYDCMKESDLVVIVSGDTYNQSDYESYEFQIQSLGPCRASCLAPSPTTGHIGISPNLFFDHDVIVSTPIWKGMCLTLDDYYYKTDHFFLSHSVCIYDQLYKGKGCKGESKKFYSSDDDPSNVNVDFETKIGIAQKESLYIKITPSMWHFIQSLSLCDFNCIGNASKNNNNETLVEDEFPTLSSTADVSDLEMRTTKGSKMEPNL